MFYYNHAENINSFGNEISWANNTFDGCAVVDRKLKVGDEIEMEIDGGSSGGHVLLGITTLTRDEIKESNRRGNRIDTVFTTTVKVLKNKVSFRLEWTSDSEMVQKLGTQVTRIPITPGHTYRPCAMLLFGFMDVTILDGKSKWCQELCGNNVRLSREKKNVSLKNGNPYAVCALSDVLEENKVMGFEVSPVDAHWYYLKIFVSPKSPSEAAARGWENFAENDLQQVIKIKNPKEQLIITLSDSTLTFVVGINSIHSSAVNVVSDKPIYLYFELFRVKLVAKAKEDIDEYEDPYVTVADPAIYETPMSVGPVLRVKKPEEVKKCERASANLDRLKDVVSNSDTQSSKLSEIYEYIKKFDKDLSSVECQYQGTEGVRALPEIPTTKQLKYRPGNISSDSGIGSAGSLCSTCNNITDGATKNITDGATNKITDGATNKITDGTRNKITDGATNNILGGATNNPTGGIHEDKSEREPRLPTIYVRDGSEDLKMMIKSLIKRVSELERKKKITIASSINLQL